MQVGHKFVGFVRISHEPVCIALKFLSFLYTSWKIACIMTIFYGFAGICTHFVCIMVLGLGMRVAPPVKKSPRCKSFPVLLGMFVNLCSNIYDVNSMVDHKSIIFINNRTWDNDLMALRLIGWFEGALSNGSASFHHPRLQSPIFKKLRALYTV